MMPLMLHVCCKGTATADDQAHPFNTNNEDNLEQALNALYKPVSTMGESSRSTDRGAFRGVIGCIMPGYLHFSGAIATFPIPV